MRFDARICGFALWLLRLVAAQPPLPTLPAQFEAVIEGNILEKNYSMVLHEFYNFDRNVDAAHFLFPGGDAHELELGDLRLHLVYFGEYQSEDYPLDCTGIVLGENNSRNFNSSTGNVVSTSEWLVFGPEFDELYVGRSSARGIDTDVWVSNFSDSGAEPDPYQTDFSLEYHFTVPGWGTPGAADFTGAHPIRVIMRGERQMFPVGEAAYTVPFHHVYDYIAFRQGPETDSYETRWVYMPPGPLFYDKDNFYDPAVYNFSKMCNVTQYCDDMYALIADSTDSSSSLPTRAGVDSVCRNGGLAYRGNPAHFLNEGVQLDDGANDGSDDNDDDDDGHSDAVLAGSFVAALVFGAVIGAVALFGFQRCGAMRGFHMMKPDSPVRVV